MPSTAALVAHVGMKEQPVPTCRCDGFSRSLGARLIGVVVYAHVRSGGCQRDGDCLTDTLRCAGDEGNGAVQRHHPLALLQSLQHAATMQFAKSADEVRLLQPFLWSMRICRCRHAGYKPALPVNTSPVFPAVDGCLPLPPRRLQTCATGQQAPAWLTTNGLPAIGWPSACKCARRARRPFPSDWIVAVAP